MAYVPMLMLLYDFENRNISLYALVAFQFKMSRRKKSLKFCHAPWVPDDF